MKSKHLVALAAPFLFAAVARADEAMCNNEHSSDPLPSTRRSAKHDASRVQDIAHLPARSRHALAARAASSNALIALKSGRGS
jgi:hypothetical protein